ncbi:type II and III secretion system protein [Psychrobacter sp. KCTC 72983]|uniref:type II and III secretion system protein n=1 Tax=Psychrobacter sp. KCTC 72983 TaxID=2733866 RepID=UPI001E3549B5|nr:type II and III secretion system protein [Psychrobacter sp. KCTC 72983]
MNRIKHELASTVLKVNITKNISLPAFALSLAVLPITVQASNVQTYVIDTYGGATLLPTVKQQLNNSADGGTVSIYQGKLVLITTPRNYQMIQQLLTQIDRQPQALTVAVRVGNSSSVQDNIRQGQVIITKRNIQGSGVWNQSNGQKQSSSLYQVQTLSGSAASISTGTLYSLTQNYRATIQPNYHYPDDRQPNAQIVIQQQVLLPTTQGIAVTPRLLPNGQIEVRLSQVEERLARSNSSYNRYGTSSNSIQSQSLNSTIIVPRGQWVTIGEISQRSTSSGSRTTNSINSVPIALLVQ